MRNNLLAFLLGVFLLGSCASPNKPLTYRQQLDVYKGMKTRLFLVGDIVKSAGVDVCPNGIGESGILTHQLSDYPKRMQAVAQSYWGLTNTEARLASTRQMHHAVCRGTLVLSYEDVPNAWSDGEDIFISPALLNEVGDLSLALIIAHELAHIALNHIELEPSEKLEREADRFALFILARAKLDYRTAALQDVASRQPHMSGGQTYLDTTKRADYFRKVVAEIEELQADGKALVP